MQYLIMFALFIVLPLVIYVLHLRTEDRENAGAETIVWMMLVVPAAVGFVLLLMVLP